jgi:hypothetical protein
MHLNVEGKENENIIKTKLKFLSTMTSANSMIDSKLKAIEDNNLNIVCNIEIRTMQEQVWWAPDILGSDSDWHNGYFIALIKKG